jgi:hypothetical protein
MNFVYTGAPCFFFHWCMSARTERRGIQWVEGVQCATAQFFHFVAFFPAQTFMISRNFQRRKSYFSSRNLCLYVMLYWVYVIMARSRKLRLTTVEDPPR